MTEKVSPVTVKIATELRVAIARMPEPPTNAEIATKAKISAMAVGRYLKGERAIPMPTYVAICEALGVNPAKIMADAMK
ncbi:helix-turn-helix transcriptional regulator [Arthrobacter sp. GMC3]|uniref:helix-turn-helix domain-containing protein n=1 Tax=Arthrobacter sp. GMC3 TaxID=2058894 RepID=UPI000CE30C89|nr:helix-turn-helix transcriptional regulator [Arthrobacter sp. GMC3]